MHTSIVHQAVPSGTVTLQHAELGVSQQVPVRDLSRATPAQLLTHLQRHELIPPATAERPYLVVSQGRTLSMQTPFAEQGVGDGAVLTLVSRGTAAATPERRTLDYETFAASFPQRGPVVSGWSAYRSLGDAETDTPTTRPERARVYLLDLTLPLPTDALSTHDRWRIRLDASQSSYPHTAPEAHVLSYPRPWNPHVRPSDGWVCQGTLWLPTKLLAFFVLDLLRTLNFDFGHDVRSYEGHFCPDAVNWWRSQRGGRPLHLDVYPTVLTPQARETRELEDLFGPL